MAEHVTFVRMVALPRKRNAVIKHMGGWESQHGASAPGAMGTYMGGEYDQPDVLWGMIRWDNRRNYQRNADRPAQDAWYQQLRAMLAADPEWHDCSMLGAWDMPGSGVAAGRNTRAVPASGSAAKAAARTPSRTQATSPARTSKSAPAPGASAASRPASRPSGSGGMRGGSARRAPRG